MLRELAALTWQEAERAADAGAVLVVPVGSTEQHGPHLPLATDTVIATALAARLAETRDDVVVAPAVSYAASGEHAGFPGTASVGTEVTRRLLVELGRSALEEFGRLLFVNAHGGNLDALSAAVAMLASEGRDVRAFTPSWRGHDGDIHAGLLETSLMLAIAPDSVRSDRAQAGVCEPLGDLLPRLRADGVRAVSENGVLGDPAGASATFGEQLLAAATQRLTRDLDAWLAA